MTGSEILSALSKWPENEGESEITIKMTMLHSFGKIDKDSMVIMTRAIKEFSIKKVENDPQ